MRFGDELRCGLAVRGTVAKWYDLCSSERNAVYGTCGPQGELFEQRVTFIQRAINFVTKKEK